LVMASGDGIMKITKRQLKKIIYEAMPAGGVPDIVGAVTGVYGEEQRQLLDDLGGMYSDMYKELYRRRPRIPMFKTIEEAEAAVDEIWAEYEAVNRAKDELVQQDLEFQEMERRRQELMPGEYDIELPMQSGMGRRQESRMRITKRQLRRIIREACALETGTPTVSPEMGVAAGTGMGASVPVPEDYDAVRDLLNQNPGLVDMGVNLVMQMAGASCERSTTQAVIDHLQSMLDGGGTIETGYDTGMEI